MKITSKISFCIILFTSIIWTTGCQININEDEDCLRCTYKISGQEVSEELCDPFFTASEKAAMRIRMQAKADSLGTILNCDEY